MLIAIQNLTVYNAQFSKLVDIMQSSGDDAECG